MPQVQLPIFPAGSVEINRDLACRTEAEQVVYYNGHLPIFTHAKSDLASFRLFTSQLIVQGSATQGHVAKAFGVPLIAIKRATKLYRQRSAAGFFVPKPRREGSKLNTKSSNKPALCWCKGILWRWSVSRPACSRTPCARPSKPVGFPQ